MGPISQSDQVLIFRTGHLGDTVCAIPAFRRVRAAYSNAKLFLLCDAPHDTKVPATEVVEALKLFDGIFSYRARRGLITFLQLARAICATRPRTVIMLPQERASPATVRRMRRFFTLLGVRDVRGFESPAVYGEWRVSEAQRLIEILEMAGVPGGKPDYALPLDGASVAFVEENLRAAGVPRGEPLLAFCGGGKVPAQRWPLRRYAEVLRAVVRELGWPIVGLGSPAEIEGYQRELLPLCPELKLMPRPLTIGGVVELLRRSTAYLGNDTGPMHVAAAVDCPVAVIMSARNAPGAWDPDVQPSLVIRHRTECEGCFLSECTHEGHRCMTSITAEQVTTAIVPFLRSLPARRAAMNTHEFLP